MFPSAGQRRNAPLPTPVSASLSTTTTIGQFLNGRSLGGRSLGGSGAVDDEPAIAGES